jgi:thiol:disulfide interchange protein DsbD
VGDKRRDESAPLSFAPADSYGQVAAAAATFANFLDRQSSAVAATDAERAAERAPVLRAADQYDLEQVKVDDAAGTLAYYIALAFVGGLILNLMPCVLPVIGLKVMSFVEQAHRSRSHALVLNLWYAAGIVSVFVLLGLLAAMIGLGWGGQFGSTPFNVTLAAIIFAMALSLLGLWEVPIPGFFGSGSVQAAAAQEGPLGAFLKGVVTTVLATPCTAPFMAAAVAWAVAQPLGTTLIVFASLGLGMASPYLLVGVYPELLRFLPKPGAWMETFKQQSGFVLLATVVFILSFVEPAAVVPTVALLMGVGIACWIIGRTPLAAESRDRLRTWGYASAVILAFLAVSFGWLYPDIMRPRFETQFSAAPAATTGPWQPFSLEKLKQLAVDSGKTVLVDFSADWCFNCKVLEKAVLHTEPVENAIAELDVVTMYADYTHYPPEIDNTIKSLGANGVPVIAIYPGGAPYEPIVFRGGYTQRGLIDGLEKATGRRLQTGTQSVAGAATVASPVN